MVIKSRKFEGMDRERKRLSNKKSDLYCKSRRAEKANYQKSKKSMIARRKSAHHTRMIEKSLSACTTNTIAYTLGFYDGFLGSQRDFYELEESECIGDPFLPNLNWREEDQDDLHRPSLSDPRGRLDALARDAKLDSVIADLMDRFN